MTSLNEHGLTPELILNGERIEFDAEEKVNTRKNSYVRYDFAEKIINACMGDLTLAYQKIEELESELSELGANYDSMQKEAETSAGQVQKMLAGEKELGDAEKLLAKFEQQLDALAKDKASDKATIASLTTQVQELVELRDTVPQLEADVNAVLDNLRSYFAEEGIDIPGDAFDDDLSSV